MLFALALFLTRTVFLPWIGRGQTTPAGRPAITGIAHIAVYAKNIPKSAQFYGTLLGWVEVPAGDAKSGVRFYLNRSQYVELVSPPADQDPADLLDVIAFSTDNADAMRRFLAGHGVSVPSTVTPGKDGSRYFVTHDPSGRKIEFVQAGSHAPQKPRGWRPISTHIIHAGFIVRDRAAEDRFYKDLLGFRLYWHGGQDAQHPTNAAMQVPDGTDWIEYMLSVRATPSRRALDSANHFAPGVVSVARTQSALQQRGWKPDKRERPRLACDGKWQLNLFDPDGTRVEFMEFQPVKAPCYSPFTGPQPAASSRW